MKYIHNLYDIYDKKNDAIPDGANEVIDSQVARRKIVSLPEGPLDSALSNLFFNLNGDIVTAYHHLLNYDHRPVPNHEFFAIIKARKPTKLSNSPHVALMRRIEDERNKLQLSYFCKSEREQMDTLITLDRKLDTDCVLWCTSKDDAGAYVGYTRSQIGVVWGENKMLVKWLVGRLREYIEKAITNKPTEVQGQMREYIELLRKREKHLEIAENHYTSASNLLGKIEDALRS